MYFQRGTLITAAYVRGITTAVFRINHFFIRHRPRDEKQHARQKLKQITFQTSLIHVVSYDVSVNQALWLSEISCSSRGKSEFLESNFTYSKTKERKKNGSKSPREFQTPLLQGS